MRGELSKQWLKKLDIQFELVKRHILLVDDCFVHKVVMELYLSELVYLPANTTAILQSMNQNMIKILRLSKDATLLRR